MPIYEYQAQNFEESCSFCVEKFEILQGMNEPEVKKCPECNNNIMKMFSTPSIIDGNRQPNQYPEVKGAKYWRDTDGNRHLVKESDGDKRSSTHVPKKTRSDAEIKAMKQKDAQVSRQKRLQAQTRARINRIKSIQKGKK